ncbi:DUF523 domain-containing protein [Candidatus Bathyarchaeota archaeon]|nr:DUF523 domain-containing protein [Candidatus Bathyarchaeota archaeon]
MKPRVVVSRCLGFEACRWDAEIICSDEVDQLREVVEFVTVCPETGIGLGVPRKPISLILVNGETRVIQKDTGRDVTDELEGFTERFLDELGEVDRFILKSRSPSCGLGTTKIRVDSGVSLGSGVFASRVERRYGGHVIIDEDELREMGTEAFLRLVSEP